MEEKKLLNVWTYKDLVDRITKQAKKENRSRSNFIANIAMKYLDKIEKEK